MQDFVQVTGMVIKVIPVGEYDRAVTILTKERGKISAFARNSRKMNNRFMAGTNPFCFGVFRLYEGRNSYTINDVQISQYFEELRLDLEGAYYGMYFLEVADYYTRENNDEAQMLKLLYQSMRALIHKGLSNELVRMVFECKAMAVNGEFPGAPQEKDVSEAAAYTMNFISETPIEKLYTFSLTNEVLAECQMITKRYRDRIWNHTFKSQEILEEFLY
ncbi:MAG: DNA repair protein RecO [Lachnospiraceae bacterium]|nr:DNA repair protein RecO [Lachnospiraceae bacterium]